MILIQLTALYRIVESEAHFFAFLHAYLSFTHSERTVAPGCDGALCPAVFHLTGYGYTKTCADVAEAHARVRRQAGRDVQASPVIVHAVADEALQDHRMGDQIERGADRAAGLVELHPAFIAILRGQEQTPVARPFAAFLHIGIRDQQLGEGPAEEPRLLRAVGNLVAQFVRLRLCGQRTRLRGEAGDALQLHGMLLFAEVVRAAAGVIGAALGEQAFERQSLVEDLPELAVLVQTALDRRLEGILRSEQRTEVIVLVYAASLVSAHRLMFALGFEIYRFFGLIGLFEPYKIIFRDVLYIV